MNVLSLFNGMSNGRIAFDREGIKIDKYYSSEVDKYAMIVADKNYPQDVEYKLGDVRYIDTSKLPKIDILIGGSPCQNFSFVGKRNGMTTTEDIEITSLDQYLKLKEEGFEFKGQSYLFWEYVRILREIKPKYFLLENVKMLKKWEDVLSENIGVKPIMINSNLVSAQNRKRLYWTNIPGVDKPKDKGYLLKDVMDNGFEGLQLSEKAWDYLNRSSKKWSNGKRRLDIYDNKLDRKSLCLTANMYKGIPYGVVSELNRRLNVIECERLQTVPDNYTAGVSNTQRYKMLGNGWTVDVIAHIFKGLKNEVVSEPGYDVINGEKQYKMFK